MDTIFLSIIVPVYNTEKYLKDCLESLIQVVDVPYEIICVNDGSLDNSLFILEEYSKKYNFIQVISQLNGGLSVARNTGIMHANGEYIMFLDSDDMLAQGAIANVCELLQNEFPEILSYDADCMYENEYLKSTQFKDEYYCRKKSYGQNKLGQSMFCEMIEQNDFCDAAWLLVIRRKWLLEKQIFFTPGLIYEDCLFSFQCYMKSQKISHINKRLIIYRIRENSIMQSMPTAKNIESRLEIYSIVLRYLMDIECEKRLQNALEKFLEFIGSNLKLTYDVLMEEEKEKLDTLSCIKRVILKNLCDTSILTDCDTRVYIKGFTDLLNCSEDIYIYGAGKVGNMMYEYLKKIGMQNKIKGFIVSDKKSVSQDRVLDVMEISEIEDANALILLCARKDYQEEMYLETKKYNFANVIPINYRLENYIASI